MPNASRDARRTGSTTTMTDVARRAGVSLSTVSYVISGVRPISDPTRARVLEAMEELDFAPNALARGLAERRSRIIAVLVPTDESEVDPFMAQIIVSAAAEARASGYHLLLGTEPPGESSELNDLVRQGLIDGTLVLAVRLEDERIDLFADAGVPLTMIGRTSEPGAHPYIDSDADQATRLAVDHLADLGHSSIVFIGPPQTQIERNYGIVVRLIDGLRRAAADEGIELHVSSCARTPEAGRAEIRRVVEAVPGATAVIVMNDPAIGGVLSGLTDTARTVPADFSLLGLYTTGLVAGLTAPPLTTVSPPAAEIGRLAAEILIDVLDDGDPAPRHELVDSVLAIRGSTARRPGT